MRSPERGSTIRARQRATGAGSASLSEKRILVTRSHAQAASLCDRLAALGAHAISFPTIKIAPPESYAALDRAVAALADYHWVIFTSVNGVAAFWSRLQAAGAQFPAAVRCAAIGPATAGALASRGVRAEFIPEEYVAEGVVAGLGDLQGQRVLLPRADIARRALADELSQRGAIVTEVTAYRTLTAEPDPVGLAEWRRGVDVIVFTSSSTVRGFLALVSGGPPTGVAAGAQLTERAGPPAPSLGRAAVACIGPITAATAREAGLPVDVVAKEYTTDGVVAALVEYFARLELA